MTDAHGGVDTDGGGPVAAAVPAPQLDLTFAPDASGISRLVRRRVRYPYSFLKPFWFGDRPDGIATAILQSASGGLFGGERLGQRIVMQRGAALHVTTQAAAIVHARRGGAAAAQRIDLQLGADSFLEYLPEPMLLFPDAGLLQRIAVTMDPAAVLLLGDGVVAHDPDGGMPGDRPFGLYQGLLEVRLPDGRLLFADRSAVTGQGFDRALAGGGRRRRACGWFALVAPAAQARLPALKAALQAALDGLPPGRGSHAAVAELPNGAGLWCRIATEGGGDLRLALRACHAAARLALTGAAAPRNRK